MSCCRAVNRTACRKIDPYKGHGLAVEASPLGLTYGVGTVQAATMLLMQLLLPDTSLILAAAVRTLLVGMWCLSPAERSHGVDGSGKRPRRGSYEPDRPVTS